MCIEWGNNLIGGLERPKHIEHFEHEVIQNGAIRLVKVPRGLCPQEEKGRKGYQVESRLPFRGVCYRLGMPRPKLDIKFNPSRPGDLRQEGSQLFDGSGPMRIVQLRACISTDSTGAVLPNGPYIRGQIFGDR